MNKNNVIEFEGREASTYPLSELLLSGAQKLIFQAVEAGLYSCLSQPASRGTYVVERVSPVPIPAAAWLFGSALLGLGALKRKKG